MKRIHYYIIAAVMALCTVSSCVDDDPISENRYANTSEMVNSFLMNRSETYSEFITVLQRAGLWDLMGTYGEYTCFAPTNDAIHTYLQEHGLQSLDQLSKADCDTMAWTHIIKDTYFITDVNEGSFQKVNMNGRYLTLSCDSDMANGGNLVYLINARCKMIHYDDSVENGVVHTLDRVISSTGKLVPDIIKADSLLTIFTAALVETHLSDSLTKTFDERYTISPDSCNVVQGSKHHRTFGNNDVYWEFPENRKFLYTVFVETDEVFKKKGINNLDDLKAYAKRVYDNTYPEDAGLYDNDFTHRKNPLNRFVAYHILDRYASYSELTVAGQNDRAQFKTELQDITEYYETMCPYTIVKVSDAAGDKWLNRLGVGARVKNGVRGSRILSPTEAGHETDALNGLYHYIEDILVYDKEKTINQALNVRMRIDATTLSPDFMNAGARNLSPTPFSHKMVGFKPGFTKNFIFSDGTFFGVHNRFWCNSWENDMCACLDNFDIKFKLPPVPAGQTYEIRIGYVCGTNRTVVQIYFDDNLTGDIPCDIPVDLRLYAGSYGWKADADCANEEEIEAVDKSMRNNGFMKGYSAFVPGYGGNTGDTPRDWIQCMRRILTTRYLEPEHDYYIRLRQVLENNAEMSLDYFEIVPKSVYDGAVAEDRY